MTWQTGQNLTGEITSAATIMNLCADHNTDRHNVLHLVSICRFDLSPKMNFNRQLA